MTLSHVQANKRPAQWDAGTSEPVAKRTRHRHQSLFDSAIATPQGNLTTISTRASKRPPPTRTSVEQVSQRFLNSEERQSRLNNRLKNGITRGVIDICASALRCGADPNTQSDKGNTVLHLAVIKKNTYLARLALEKGASPIIKNRDGLLPSSLITENHSFPKELLIDWVQSFPDMNIIDSNGNSFLHIAITDIKNTEVILACLEKGADVNLARKDGMSPLGIFYDLIFEYNEYLALKKLEIDFNWIYRELIQRGAKFDNNFIYNYSFLHIACIKKYRDLALSALVLGERFDTLSDDGKYTPLIFLFKYQEPEQYHSPVKEQLLELAIKLRLSSDNTLDSYRPYQKCLKQVADPFLAKALFALTAKRNTGEDLLTEKEKKWLIMEVTRYREYFTFLCGVLKDSQFAEIIFPFFIKYNFYKPPFSEHQWSHILSIIDRYPASTLIKNAYAELFTSQLPSEEKLDFLYFLPFIDEKMYMRTSNLAETLMLQKYPSTVDDSDFVSIFFDHYPSRDIGRLTMKMLSHPGRLGQLIERLSRIDNKDWLFKKTRLSIIREARKKYPLIGKNPAFRKMDLKQLVMTLVAVAYYDNTPHRKGFDLYALKELPADVGAHYFNNLSESAQHRLYGHIFGRSLEIQSLSYETIQVVIKKMTQTDRKLWFNKLLTSLEIPSSPLIPEVLSDPETIESLTKMIPLFAQLNFSYFSQKFSENLQQLKNQGETWMEDPQGYLLYFFIQLMLYSSLKREVKLKFLTQLDDVQFLAFFSQLFFHPEWAEEFNSEMCVQFDLETKDRGRARNSWEEFTKSILIRLNQISCSTPSTFLQHYHRKMAAAKLAKPKVLSSQWFVDMEKQGWKFLRWQGRTMLMKQEQTGRILAIKWHKVNEKVEELPREARTAKILKEFQQELQLKSTFPDPIGVFQFDGNIPAIYTSSPTVPTVASQPDQPKVAYVYECENEDYFIYLNDPKLDEKQFNKARKIGMHDLGKLGAEELVMVALADLYHNQEIGHEAREDGGRFLTLVGLVRPHFFGEGAGRLSRLWKSIEFVNLGLSGLRDVGDSDSIPKLSNPNHPIFNRNFSDLTRGNRTNQTHPKIPAVLKANFFADYLQVDELLVGARAKSQGHLSWRSRSHLDKTAKLLKKGPSKLISSYLGVRKQRAKAFIKKNGVDWVLYAKQMGFWMQNNRNGYLPFVKKKKLPKSIYPAGVKLSFGENLRGWSDEKGFVIDGVNPDLGTVNGPYPITEGVKDRWINVTYMLVMREALALAKTLQEMAMSEPDPEIKQSLLQSVSHLNLEFCNR